MPKEHPHSLSFTSAAKPVKARRGTRKGERERRTNKVKSEKEKNITEKT